MGPDPGGGGSAAVDVRGAGRRGDVFEESARFPWAMTAQRPGALGKVGGGAFIRSHDDVDVVAGGVVLRLITSLDRRGRRRATPRGSARRATRPWS